MSCTRVSDLDDRDIRFLWRFMYLDLTARAITSILCGNLERAHTINHALMKGKFALCATIIRLQMGSIFLTTAIDNRHFTTDCLFVPTLPWLPHAMLESIRNTRRAKRFIEITTSIYTIFSCTSTSNTIAHPHHLTSERIDEYVSAHPMLCSQMISAFHTAITEERTTLKFFIHSLSIHLDFQSDLSKQPS